MLTKTACAMEQMWTRSKLWTFLSTVRMTISPTSFPGSSRFLKKVPWLQLVKCLCMPTQATQRVGSQLNFVITVWGGECSTATQTLF